MDNIVVEKSEKFALRIIGLYKYLCMEKKEYVMSRQILKSGTSIGANIREAQYGQSKKDFTSKMYISLKETSETEYWLNLLYKSNYISEASYISIKNDCIELLKLLTSIVKTVKI